MAAHCLEIAVVPQEVQDRLEALQADWPEDDRWQCDFDEHEGDHWTIAVYGGADRQSEDLWLRWSTGEPARLVEHPGCEAIAPSGDDSGPYCYWVDGHPGLHSSGDERW